MQNAQETNKKISVLALFASTDMLRTANHADQFWHGRCSNFADQ